MGGPSDTDDQLPIINGLATIAPICHALSARVTTFLETEAATPLLKAVQEQTRIALGVIDTALEKYRYFSLPIPIVFLFLFLFMRRG